ncbi:MAG: GMP synthase [Chitinophagales bacterium]|nr:GMP synthase [Chitinophagales bacterium]
MKKVKLAILDMNKSIPNQGLRCIRDIATEFEDRLDWKVFDVRSKHEIPDLSYDIFISSGGPGNPHEAGSWTESYFNLIDSAWQLNQIKGGNKKHIFFICYSFQMACEHFQLGSITKRKRTSFGIYPVHKTAAGLTDPILNGLDNPYYAVDSRDWQLVQPRLKVFEEHGASILSLEKIRTHVEYERAIMAVRFSDEFVGTQFHPEADPIGMKSHFSKKENRDKVISNFDENKYEDMMLHLSDPDKIKLTHSVILPSFISKALASLNKEEYINN